MQDPIADMLTQIRNAQAIAKEGVSLLYSKIKTAIAEVLKKKVTFLIIKWLSNKKAPKRFYKFF